MCVPTEERLQLHFTFVNNVNNTKMAACHGTKNPECQLLLKLTDRYKALTPGVTFSKYLYFI